MPTMPIDDETLYGDPPTTTDPSPEVSRDTRKASVCSPGPGDEATALTSARQRCRICGCTDLDGTMGWVEPDLCSACVPEAARVSRFMAISEIICQRGPESDRLNDACIELWPEIERNINQGDPTDLRLVMYTVFSLGYVAGAASDPEQWKAARDSCPNNQ